MIEKPETTAPRKMRFRTLPPPHDEDNYCAAAGCVPVEPQPTPGIEQPVASPAPSQRITCLYCAGTHDAMNPHWKKDCPWWLGFEEGEKSVAQPESPAPMSAREFRAYYYKFYATGHAGIDKILQAVGAAGKCYHSTADWNDEPSYTPDGLTGKTPVEWIQNAAEEAFAAQSQPSEQEQFNQKWQLAHADKEVEFLMDGDLQVSKLRYHREGESMSTGNVGAWYASAVFWREMYDRLKAQSQPSRAIQEAELQRRVREALEFYAHENGFVWNGDGYEWRGANLDYRSDPRLPANGALAILRTLESKA